MPKQEIKTIITHRGSQRFAQVSSGKKEVSVLLRDTKATAYSLLECAAELRGDAAKALERAALLESAAWLLKAQEAGDKSTHDGL